MDSMGIIKRWLAQTLDKFWDDYVDRNMTLFLVNRGYPNSIIQIDVS